jgi:hypothetical protein
VGILVALYFRKAVNAARASQGRKNTFTMPQQGIGSKIGD